MGWLGLDDTDSLAGGCTTAVFHALLDGLPDHVRYDDPRLVRLWPFAGRRTRGNAALGVELHTADVPSLLAHLDRWWSSHIAPLKGRIEPSTMSDRKQSPASPGMVWFEQQPPHEFYFSAVRSNVELGDVPEPDRAWGEHGRIGATAALAWPAKVATWEAIAWRPPSTTDQPRRVDGDALEAVDGWLGTFLSRDPRNGTGLIAPRGRSPVLFGLRATTKAAAEEGCRHLLAASGTEPASGWRVFRSNQASGDHLDEPYRLTVERVEVHNQRKHAIVFTDGPSVKAYAEGGPVNALARWLAPGDVVLVHGLEHEGFVHAERLKVDAWMPRAQQRPTCATCKVRMKSMGAGQGLRCPRCKQRAPDTWEPVAAAPPFPSWVEPPASARRHLARPLAWDEQL